MRDTTNLVFALFDIGEALLVTCIWAGVENRPGTVYWFCMVFGWWSVLFAVVSIFIDEWVNVFGWTIAAAIYFHYVWNNRPNKRKRVDKVLGLVKSLGHRLVVVPEHG